MWSDNETEIDLLGFEHLANAVVSIVRRDDLLPATIGVYGDWGGGKSSLLKIVQKQLEEDEAVIVLSFNGWLFEDYENAKTALMGSILEELLNHRKILPKAKEKIKNLLKRVNGFKLVAGVGKIALGLSTGVAPLAASGGWDFLSLLSLVKGNAKDAKFAELKDAIEEKNKKEEEDEADRRRQIREFRKDFAELLDESNIKKLVVIIDDLDRCLPDTIIDTLEAIKLFLFVKNTAFILGADEYLVKYAVRKRFPELPGERAEVGRDYLEKLVQFPVRVPPLGRAAMETYIALLFTDLAAELDEEQRRQAREFAIKTNSENLSAVNFNLTIAQELFGDRLPNTLKEQLTLAGRISPVLASGLKGNPRQCKRFLNTLLMRLEMAAFRKVELQQRVLAKLMLLEYFKPESFRRLADLQSEQNGQPREIAAMEQAARGRDESETDNESGGEERKAAADVKESSKEKKSEIPKDISPKSAPATPEKPPKLEGEFQLWLSQPWTDDWLQMEPRLAGIDLRPYFFFSRDLLSTSLGIETNRMSQTAQEILTALLNESQAVRDNALKRLENLSLSDIASLFENLSQRAQQEEDYGKNNQSFQRLFDLTKTRKEIRGEFILFLNRLPESAIHAVVVLQLLGLYENNQQIESAVIELLQKWESSGNRDLAKIAGKRLEKISER
jgi:hypothetical protein